MGTKEKIIHFYKNNKTTKEDLRKDINDNFRYTIKQLSDINLEEFLKGCINIHINIEGYKYYGGEVDDKAVNPFQIIFDNIRFDGGQLVQEALVFDLINDVFDGKSIQPLIEKYNITFITI